MKAWKAALAAAIATAAIALVVVAPMAQSSRSPKGLKVVTEIATGAGHSTATAKCPRGFVVVAGGFEGQGVNVTSSEKRDARRWTVRAQTPVSKRGQLLRAQAVCAKGTGGFRITDVEG